MVLLWMQVLSKDFSKEVEARAVLAALEKAMKNDYDKVQVLLDVKEVVHALKGDRD